MIKLEATSVSSVEAYLKNVFEIDAIIELGYVDSRRISLLKSVYKLITIHSDLSRNQTKHWTWLSYLYGLLW